MRWAANSIISPQAIALKQAEAAAAQPRAAIRIVLPGEAKPPEPVPILTELGGEPPPAGLGLSATGLQPAVLSEPPPGLPLSPVPSPPLPAASPTLDVVKAWLAQRDAMLVSVEDERMRLRARLAELDLLAAELEAIGAKA